MPETLIPQGHPDDVADIGEDSVGCMWRLHARHGAIVSYQKSDHACVFIFGERANQELLSATASFHVHSLLPGPRSSAQRRLTHGLFSMNGERHQQHRRLMMRPFRKELLPNYAELLGSLTDDILDTWRTGKTIDIAAEARRIALRLATRVIFGVEDFPEGHEVDRLFDVWMPLNHMVSLGLLLPYEVPAHAYEQLLDCAIDMESLMKLLVRQHRAERGAGDVNLFGQMVDAADAGVLSDVELVGETTHLFNAAYHTSGFTLTWLLLLLTQHPDIARALADECASMGDQGELLERTIKEGMRILPVVSYLPRTAVEDVELLGHGFRRKTVFLASPYVTHHLPEIYAEPERFDPARWLREKPGPFGYLPFGAGSRMCVGATFALMMMRIVLARVMRRVRLTLTPGITINRRANLTFGTHEPIPATVWPADGNWSTQPIAGNIRECVHFATPLERREAA